jgi:hypothetical protein
MQIINKTIQCPQCGCIAFPDAIHCPKCGSNYRENKAKTEIKEMLKITNYLSTQGRDNTDNTIMKACYQLTCPHHGQIDVKAAVIVPIIKCPLCQEN